MPVVVRWLAPVSLAIASGFIVWIGIGTLTDDREAWDSPLYMWVGVPALALITGTLAYFFPAHPRLLGILPMGAQAVWVYATEPLGPLWAVGLLFFAMFGMFCVIAADVGARKGRTRRPQALNR